MDRLLVVIALLAPHRELPGRDQHHGRPVLAENRRRELDEGPCLRGRVPICRRVRLPQGVRFTLCLMWFG